MKTKERYKVKGNFLSRLPTTEKIKAIISDLLTNKEVGNMVYKFRNHPSIVKTKEWYKVKGNFYLDFPLQLG